MASKKFYADIATQTNVRITGDAVDTTSGGTSASDKVITSGAVHSGLATKAALAGSSTQDFETQNLTVNGDLTITGEINQQTVNNLQVDDREITLNNGGSLGTNTSGVSVDGSGVTTDARIYYDGSDHTWYMKEADVAAVAIGTGTSNFDGAYSSLTGIPTTFAPSAHTHDAADITSGTIASARLTGTYAISVSGNAATATSAADSDLLEGNDSAYHLDWTNFTNVPTTFAPSSHTHAATEITSGTFVDARIAASNVTQHEGALSIDWSQLASVPVTFAPSAHNHAASEITSGTFADARVASSNVTQHEGDLAIAWSQLTSVPEVAQMYKKAFSGSPTSVTCTMPSAVAAANAIVQVIDNNFDLIDCAIDRSAGSADIVVSFDTALTGGTVLITSYDGTISTNSL